MAHFLTSFLCILLYGQIFSQVAGRPETSEESSSSSSQKLPNIVLITSEFGFHDVGFNNEAVITPNIDKLASKGVILDKFYSAQTTSEANSMLLTGKHMSTLGMHGDVIRPDRAYGLPLDTATLADRLKEQGYATHYVGKWHQGNFKREYTPTYRGFDTFYGYYNAKIEEFSFKLPCPNNLSDWGYDMWDSEGENLRPVRPQDMVGSYSSQLFCRRAIRNIDRHDKTKPFFMTVAVQDPTSSGPETPQIYVDLYNADTMALGLRQRFAKATIVDDLVGYVVEALEFNNMMENTLIIFTSSNGGPSVPKAYNLTRIYATDIPWWFYMPDEEDLYLHVPTLFYSASLLSDRQGAHVNDYVHMSDLFPTLMHVAGIPYAEDEQDMYGMNMWPTIRDGVQGPRNSMLVKMRILGAPAGGTPLYTDTFDTRWYAHYIHDGFKLVTGYFSAMPKTYWLYDIAADPHEDNDLSDLPAYTSRVRAILDDLQAWFLNTPPPLHFLPSSAQDPAACPRHHGGYFAPWK